MTGAVLQLQMILKRRGALCGNSTETGVRRELQKGMPVMGRSFGLCKRNVRLDVVPRCESWFQGLDSAGSSSLFAARASTLKATRYPSINFSQALISSISVPHQRSTPCFPGSIHSPTTKRDPTISDQSRFQTSTLRPLSRPPRIPGR